MNGQNILKTIKKFAENLPRFPDGRIDYSNSNIAPVITAFVRYKNKILILKRSNKVRIYQRKWNAVAGYLDELKPIRKKILEELKEELGIDQNNISGIHLGKSYKFTDKKLNKIWIIHPALVELKIKPEIKLDWEHTKYKWIKPKELENFDVIPKLRESLNKVIWKNQ